MKFTTTILGAPVLIAPAAPVLVEASLTGTPAAKVFACFKAARN